jgi:hypothetical protein
MNEHEPGEIVPKRVIERSFGWFGRCRRLAKGFDNLTRTAIAFLRRPASIRLMLRRQNRMTFSDRLCGLAGAGFAVFAAGMC